MNPYIGDRQLDPPEEDDPDDGLTLREREQQAFDDFDPDDCDFGEAL